MKHKKFLFNKVDLLVIPSITSKDGYVEGLPVVILEGMYSGTYVLQVLIQMQKIL